MIFGFNTDVKSGDTVYHVQSEARESEYLLQSQVFVKGRCIGKRATSYAQHAASPGFSEDQMHAMLKAQHKSLVDAIRAGNIEGLFAGSAAVEDIDGGGLALNWTNSDVACHDGRILMRFQVTDGGSAVAGAKVVSRFSIESQEPVYAQASTDAQGRAEMAIPLRGGGNVTDAAVLVQATYGDKTATRKFRLRKRD